MTSMTKAPPGPVHIELQHRAQAVHVTRLEEALAQLAGVGAQLAQTFLGENLLACPALTQGRDLVIHRLTRVIVCRHPRSPLRGLTSEALDGSSYSCGTRGGRPDVRRQVRAAAGVAHRRRGTVPRERPPPRRRNVTAGPASATLSAPADRPDRSHAPR
jgi:hypothetical protein